MKLNHDCIRSLLLVLEDSLQYSENLELPTLSLNDILHDKRLQKFSKQDIVYSSEMLAEADYINASVVKSDYAVLKVVYSGITFKGHEYINSIRDNNVWDSVIEKLGGNVTMVTFDVIKEVSLFVIRKFIGM